jgi:hypothetical protein
MGFYRFKPAAHFIITTALLVSVIVTAFVPDSTPATLATASATNVDGATANAVPKPISIAPLRGLLILGSLIRSYR